MMNPIRTSLGFLGGRSLSDMTEDGLNCKSSVLIGTFMIVSLVFLFLGQFQYWENSTKQNPLLIATTVTLVMFVIYLGVIRALELLGFVSRTTLIGLFIIVSSVNSYIVSHEWLFFIFQEQVESQISENYQHYASKHRTELEKNNKVSDVDAKIEKIKLEILNALKDQGGMSSSATELSSQFNNCSEMQTHLQQQIPSDISNPIYSAANRQWLLKSKECVRLQQKVTDALESNRMSYESQIQNLNTEKSSLEEERQKMMNNIDNQMIIDKPIIMKATYSGVARHDAIWQAVDAGKIPYLEAWGIAIVIFILESIVLLLKIFLPLDEAGFQNRIDFELRHLYCAIELQAIEKMKKNPHAMMGNDDLATLKKATWRNAYEKLRTKVIFG
jgi:hypothetical protein